MEIGNGTLPVALKDKVFWFMTPCRLVKSYRRFETSVKIYQSVKIYHSTRC